MGTSIQIEGAEEIRDRLKALPLKLARKVIRKCLKAGALHILSRVKANVPVDTGRWQSGVKVLSGKRKAGEIAVVVGATRKTLGVGKGKNAFYPAFVERGHAAKGGPHKGSLRAGVASALGIQSTRKRTGAGEGAVSGGRVPGRPVTEMAYEATKEQALNATISTFAAEFDAAVESKGT